MTTQFGKKFRQEHYSFTPSLIPVNSGAFGSCPTVSLEKATSVIRQQEAFPDKFYLVDWEIELRENLHALAEYTSIPEENIAFTTNATTGVNTILRSFPFDFAKDKVLIFSTTYGACANTVKFLHDRYGLQYDVVEFNFPLEKADILAKVEEKLSVGNYRLCLCDVIISMPGVILPYMELQALFTKYDVVSLFDGAHTFGNVKFDWTKFKPDFFVSNLHKWFSVPKSAAVLYISKKYQDKIESLLFPLLTT